MSTRTRRTVETDDDLMVFQGTDPEDFALELDHETVDTDFDSEPSAASPIEASYDQRLQAAQEQLLQLRQQQEAIERQKKELEELNEKQRRFVAGRTELSNNFSRSIAMLEREATEFRKRADQFDATRESFEGHNSSINELRPETWDRARLRDELGQALDLIDDVSEDYDKQISKVDALRDSETSHPAPIRSSHFEPTTASSALPTDFKQWFMMGLAFTLPITIAATVALIAIAVF